MKKKMIIITLLTLIIWLPKCDLFADKWEVTVTVNSSGSCIGSMTIFNDDSDYDNTFDYYTICSFPFVKSYELDTDAASVTVYILNAGSSQKTITIKAAKYVDGMHEDTLKTTYSTNSNADSVMLNLYW